MTGTSGPVILLPILLTLQWDTLEALGSAQVFAKIAKIALIALIA